MDDPILNKMQQLMDKYQGHPASAIPTAMSPANEPEPELPILTDIVKMGDELPDRVAPPTHDELAWQVMQTVERRLQSEFESIFTDHVQQAITLALNESLPLLRQHITSLVRSSVNEVLEKQ